MRTKALLIVVLAMLLIFSTALAETSKWDPEQVTGLAWLQMSAGERMDYVLAAMYVLAKHEVELKATPNDYYNAVQAKILHDPRLNQTALTGILASVVYETEPGSREALDKVKRV